MYSVLLVVPPGEHSVFTNNKTYLLRTQLARLDLYECDCGVWHHDVVV